MISVMVMEVYRWLIKKVFLDMPFCSSKEKESLKLQIPTTNKKIMEDISRPPKLPEFKGPSPEE
jgi:hypothetical protein